MKQCPQHKCLEHIAFIILLVYHFASLSFCQFIIQLVCVYSQNISTARKKQHRYICSICMFFHLWQHHFRIASNTILDVCEIPFQNQGQDHFSSAFNFILEVRFLERSTPFQKCMQHHFRCACNTILRVLAIPIQKCVQHYFKGCTPIEKMLEN